MNQAHQVHLLKMLDDVHKLVRNRRFKESKAGQKNVKIQCTRRDNRGFTKELYFNPGIYFDDQDNMIVSRQGPENTDGYSDASEPSTNKTKRNQDPNRHRGDSSTPSPEK